MTEEKQQGIVLKLTDYKEADKLASIFTLNQGIILAKFTGVKKEKAKLKAIAQPFVFAEFNFNSKGGANRVINASLIDNFYPILNDYNKTMCAYIMLDIINTILPKNKAENEIFLLSVNTLKNIETQNPYISLIDYILKFFMFLGTPIELINSNYVYFNKLNGEFGTKQTINSIQIDKKIYQILQMINADVNSVFGISSQIKEENLKQILRLLNNIILIKFDEEIKSFSFI